MSLPNDGVYLSNVCSVIFSSLSVILG
jgi:hypothetical protein